MRDDELPDLPSDAELQRLADEERVREHVEARSRERWLRQQATEGTTLWSVLRVAAEQEAELSVRTSAGRAHLGVVRSLGADFCLLVGPGGLAVYLPLAAVTAVTVTARLELRDIADERSDADATRLGELLVEAVADRPRVSVIALGDPDRIVGDLVAVGVDVLGIRTEDGRRSTVYVPLPRVTEVALLDG